MNWAQKVEEKRNSCSEAIPPDWKIPETVLSLLSWPLEANINNLINLDIVRLCQVLTEKELDITENHGTEELLKQLASGKLSSVEVTTAFYSENNIFGRTLNPWNTMLGPGGSSGGEGALIAFRGSPLGVGTDVGGSIRIPSLCCGVYGFKPSINRIPYGGQQDCTKPGIPGITPAAGPLCHDFGGLKMLTKAVLEAGPAGYDSTAIDVPWRYVPDVSEKKLRIGLLPEDPVYPLHPPVARVLAEAAKILEASGHQIVPLPSKQCHVADATEVTWPIFLMDDTAYKHVEAGGEPLVQSVKYLHGMARKLERRFVPETDGLDRLDRLAVLNTKKAEIIEDWKSIWNDVDVVLSPPAQSTAVEHDKFGLPPYTTLTNLIDCPSCIIPFSRVSDDDLAEPFAKGPKQIGPEYNPHLVRGAPCSVQLFTKTLHDEECLAYAEIIDGCLQASGKR
ncbi:hypothetical protein CDV36_002602 [Fusarium kuroshium]|uniref:amidase n=1 Tax=Fusarium kuroshium TaxID=2010991 RepID=A0A3M2SKB1_9HYPO|nr:hypothetical protein CDV36_002602 [Fusarium kuroshium]